MANFFLSLTFPHTRREEAKQYGIAFAVNELFPSDLSTLEEDDFEVKFGIHNRAHITLILQTCRQSGRTRVIDSILLVFSRLSFFICLKFLECKMISNRLQCCIQFMSVPSRCLPLEVTRLLKVVIHCGDCMRHLACNL